MKTPGFAGVYHPVRVAAACTDRHISAIVALVCSPPRNDAGALLTGIWLAPWPVGMPSAVLLGPVVGNISAERISDGSRPGSSAIGRPTRRRRRVGRGHRSRAEAVAVAVEGHPRSHRGRRAGRRPGPPHHRLQPAIRDDVARAAGGDGFRRRHAADDPRPRSAGGSRRFPRSHRGHVSPSGSRQLRHAGLQGRALLRASTRCRRGWTASPSGAC